MRSSFLMANSKVFFPIWSPGGVHPLSSFDYGRLRMLSVVGSLCGWICSWLVFWLVLQALKIYLWYIDFSVSKCYSSKRMRADNDHTIGSSIESWKMKSKRSQKLGGTITTCVSYSMIQEPATNGLKRMMETTLMEILKRLERSYELITSMLTVVFLRQIILVTIFLELELWQQSSLKVWPLTRDLLYTKLIRRITSSMALPIGP